jgi:hypothetical protein
MLGWLALATAACVGYLVAAAVAHRLWPDRGARLVEAVLLRAEPGDVVLIKLPADVDAQKAESIREWFLRRLTQAGRGDVGLAVMSAGIDVQVVRPPVDPESLT